MYTTVFHERECLFYEVSGPVRQIHRKVRKLLLLRRALNAAATVGKTLRLTEYRLFSGLLTATPGKLKKSGNLNIHTFGSQREKMQKGVKIESFPGRREQALSACLLPGFERSYSGEAPPEGALSAGGAAVSFPTSATSPEPVRTCMKSQSYISSPRNTFSRSP